MDKVNDGGKLLATAVNNLFKNKEPWQIVVITTGTVVSSIFLFDLLNQDECEYSGTMIWGDTNFVSIFQVYSSGRRGLRSNGPGRFRRLGSRFKRP